MRLARYIAVPLLLGLIVLAHVQLWQAETVPLEAKRRLTTLNALAWAVILLPALGVSLWLRAHLRRGQGKSPGRGS